MKLAEVSALYVYPVKSCRGIAVEEAVVATTGAPLDLWGGLAPARTPSARRRGVARAVPGGGRLLE